MACEWKRVRPCNYPHHLTSRPAIYLHLHSKPELHNDILVDLAPHVESREDEGRAENVHTKEYANYLW